MSKKCKKYQFIRKEQQDFKRKYRRQNKSIEQTSSNLQLPIIDRKLSAPFNFQCSQDPTIYLRDFATISNSAFKEMFFKKMDIQENSSIFELFHTEQTLTYLRLATQFINQLNYIRLQLEQWNYYYHLGTTEHIWTGRVSKKKAQINSMPYTYGRCKTLIEQRRKKYKQQFDGIQQEITQYLEHKVNINLEMNKLLEILDDFIEKDQSRLRMELERRRILLKFDAQEHQLVQAFYDLNARQSEIYLAKLIWRLINEQQVLVDEISIFKQWFSLKPAVTSCSFQNLGLTKINHIIVQHIFNPTTSVPTSSNTTDIFNPYLPQETLSSIENTIQDYDHKINQGKAKLQNNKEHIKKPEINIDKVIEAIEKREINMKQRAQYQTQYKNKLLLNEPATQPKNS